MSEARIVTLGRGDEGVLNRVAPGVFDGPVRAALVHEFLGDARHHLSVALDGDLVVGMASGVHYVHPDKPPELWINEVGVAPTHRRRGLGRRLVAALLESARANGCAQAWVLAEPGNDPARALYRAAGGVEATVAPVMFELPIVAHGDPLAGPRRPGQTGVPPDSFPEPSPGAAPSRGSAEVRSLLNVHLIDGTYELFRHFYGGRRFRKGADAPHGAVVGVLGTVLQMIEAGCTHFGVATDHVIESFRNRLWADYKTGEGIEPALLAQFRPLEDGLRAMGIAVWPMVELEADDGLASAARAAAADDRVTGVWIWTPDKDLAQCVQGERVVQADRRRDVVRDAAGVRDKFGVEPRLIPDYLALVGDAADGFPGIPGIGAVTAARLLNRHGPIESFPTEVLGARRDMALLFKDLATLRTDAELFDDVEDLRWRGPLDGFAAWTRSIDAPRLLERCRSAHEGLGS